MCNNKCIIHNFAVLSIAQWVNGLLEIIEHSPKKMLQEFSPVPFDIVALLHYYKWEIASIVTKPQRRVEKSTLTFDIRGD
jgi:hypothetical protein